MRFLYINQPVLHVQSMPISMQKPLRIFWGGCTGTTVENNQAFFVNKWFTCIFHHSFEDHKSGNVLSCIEQVVLKPLKNVQLKIKLQWYVRPTLLI